MTISNAAAVNKTVGDSSAEHESMMAIWSRCRAVCGGERYVKDVDRQISLTNLLIPFSPSMRQDQYDFYKMEAEFPGIVSQFKRILIGGLLRKSPELKIPNEAPEDAMEWLKERFSATGQPLLIFLEELLDEELETSNSWIGVSYPIIPPNNELTQEELDALCPYPDIIRAENVINWKVDQDIHGNRTLKFLVVRGNKEVYEAGSLHPKLIDTVFVHELDALGQYQIRVYESKAEVKSAPIIQGEPQQINNPKTGWEETEVITDILANDKRLTRIPFWPASGSFDVTEPLLLPLIDKEVSLYNKVSRRNHLLYGAATYTPVVMSDMDDKAFDAVVKSGLGTWIHLHKDDKIDVLRTPSEPLADMDRAIAANFEEMAKLGIRMLTPEVSQSGVALEIRNAAQTAQLGSLNTRISTVIRGVIAFMLNWKYDLEYTASDIAFNLSPDFNPTPLGADWLRLATEWYQQGLIPRSIWLLILQQNDMIPPDYDDDEGKKEINADEFVMQDNTDSEEGFSKAKKEETLE